MRTRQDADFARDWTQVLITAAVHPLLFVEHTDAEGFLLHVIERLRDRELVGVREFLQDGRFHLFLQGVHRFAAIDFLLVVKRAFDAVAGNLIRHLEDILVHRHQRHFALRFADLGGEFFLDSNHLSRMPVGELECFDKILFRNFHRRAFDHDHVVLGAHINEVEIARVTFVVRRVRDELAIDSTHPHRADRTGEWYVGNSERRRRAIDRENVRIVLAIGAEQHRDNLGVVEISRRKERSQRAVRHPRSERLFFRRTPFALEIAARKFSDCRRFLAVIDGERKPILAFLDLSGRDCAGEHHGITARDDDGAVGEFGDLAGFD